MQIKTDFVKIYNQDDARKLESTNWIRPTPLNLLCIELNKSAEDVNEMRLFEYINTFFNANVRNAFFHSDYIITEKNFRWTESGIAQQIGLEHLNIIISNIQSNLRRDRVHKH